MRRLLLLRGIQVLIVDDEASPRLAQIMLEQIGCTDRFDVLLLDCELPCMSGPELAACIRNRNDATASTPAIKPASAGELRCGAFRQSVGKTRVPLFQAERRHGVLVPNE